MTNLVIMVHSQFSETLLKGMFGKLSLNTTVVPFQSALQSIENHPAIFQQTVHGRNLRECDIDYILIESNYGKPADESINESLFQHILENCPTAEIFAYSGTPESLIKALEYHHRINAICKDPSILNQEATQNLKRVMTLADFKKIVDPNNRRASAPPMLAPLENSSILVRSPTTRNRSPSAPTFTPFYNTYGGSDAPVTDYATTSSLTATATDFTPSTASSSGAKITF
ncbi:MAG TPA: hypothetical protein PLD88_05980 [Candidatus Berkiella sp.]|nr:hypothetical protein [Candidatus Berkiella sp.]